MQRVSMTNKSPQDESRGTSEDPAVARKLFDKPIGDPDSTNSTGKEVSKDTAGLTENISKDPTNTEPCIFSQVIYSACMHLIEAGVQLRD